MRGSRGSLKISAGGPCSRMRPSSRKQTRLAMSRAKPISCVAMSMVTPPAGQLANDVQHLGDELRIQRARHLVEQHQLGLHGERANDRHALLLAPGQPVRIGVALLAQPEAVEQPGRARLRLGAA